MGPRLLPVRALFGETGPVSRAEYVRLGLTLAVVKYAVDAAVIYAVTGTAWTPLDYLFPLVNLGGSKAAGFPGWLDVALLGWTLPFIWAGVMLSARRAVDAGAPIWLVVLFFIPVANYGLILVLALLPPHMEGSAAAAPPVRAKTETAAYARPSLLEPSVALAIGGGVLSALVAVAVGVVWLRSYGGSLFLAGPFLLGLTTGCIANLRDSRSPADTAMLAVHAVVITAGVLVLVAFEGVLCLLMAIPLAFPLAVLGAAVGRTMAIRQRPASGWMGMVAVLLAIPAAPVVQPTTVPRVRVVMTAVDVDAPIESVWRHVVAFEDITERPSIEFRLGLAYPQRARIIGQGVGAVRYCEFSTGAFVEPITAWEEPTRLAFDVTAMPPPLREWSPYAHVYAPHLNGFFRTSHGEFRLIAVNAHRTRLEGRTWYTLDMAPQAYWAPIADTVLHRIHARVLRHIKALAE